jgi:hypothetical protein
VLLNGRIFLVAGILGLQIPVVVGILFLCGSMAKRQNRRGVKKVEKPCEQVVSSINEPIFDDFQGGTTEEHCDSKSGPIENGGILDSAMDCLEDVVVSSPVLVPVDELPVQEEHLALPIRKDGANIEKISVTEPIQDWKKLFNSVKSFGSLSYHEPTRMDGRVVVKPPREAVEKGISKWSSSLIGQFLDKPLPFYVVKRSVDNMWAAYGKVKIFLMENGLYLFRFADVRSREAGLEEKLWHIANKPLILRRWTPGMQLLKLSLSTVPIWIKMHNLPMEYWDSDCLSHIASGVGKPLCADSVTEEQLRLGFARVLVEVDIDSAFPKEVEIIGINGDVVKIGIEYPWLPIKCKKCRSFGHASHTCTKIEKSVWIPRGRGLAQQVNVPKNSTFLKGQVDQIAKASSSNEEQWNVVNKSKRTPKSHPPIVDNSQNWTNSFQLLAKVEGRKYDKSEIRKSNEALQQILDEMVDPDPSCAIDRGKGKLEGKVAAMGYESPHS